MFNNIINIINIIIFIINIIINKNFKNIINIEKNHRFNLKGKINNNMSDPNFLGGRGTRPKKLGSSRGCHS